MEPEFFLDPNFVLFYSGRDYLEPYSPALAYLTHDRKLLKLQWSDDKITYHLPETYNSVSFDTLASAFHAAYGKEMS